MLQSSEEAIEPTGAGPDDTFDDSPAATGPIDSRLECLEQILRAFRDIADFDDIHQAAERLILVQQWIRQEAESAAADPIFDEPAAAVAVPLVRRRSGARAER